MILVKTLSKSFESNIGRKIFSLAILLLVLLPVKAQQLNFKVVDKATGNPVSDVELWTFNIGKKAQAAKFSLEKEGFFDDTDPRMDVQAHARTDRSGNAIMKCGISGYVLVDIDNGEYKYTEYLSVAKFIKGADITIRIPKAAKNDDVTELKEVQKTSFRPMPAAGDGISVRHGKMKTITKELAIDPEYARTDARFVVAPRVIDPKNNDSIMLYLAPVVVDGEAYDETNYRHNYYEPTNDYGYTYQQDASLRMQNHQGERFMYVRHLYPVDRGVRYVVKGKEWYEDYKAVYYQDEIELSDGYDREPMRFLNWDDAKRKIPINREQYRKVGKSEMSKSKSNYHMEFEVGKAALNTNDSLTVSERDKMIKDINNYYQDENSQINYVTVKGYASPEGGYDKNVSLVRDRANAIVSLLESRFPNRLRMQSVRAKVESDNIVPWSVVADTLDYMPDSIAHVYADRLRNIVAQRKGLAAQEAEIKKDGAMKDYIWSKVLPRVRRVEIETGYTTMRVLSRDEIVAKYNTEENFHNGVGVADYQYYELMCYLADKEDWDGLYTISKAAYESPNMLQNATRMVATSWDKLSKKEKDDYISEHGEEARYILRRVQETRTDPLAGYYYASSLLRKGKVNTQVLKPFLDDGPVNRTTRVNGENVVEYNDISIIAMQILMYCQDDDFQAANSMVKKYNLTAYPELKTLVMFVRCLTGEYLTDPEVREFVSSSSPMNHAVIETAMGEYKTALALLNALDKDHKDARVQYLKSICRFNQLDPAQRQNSVTSYSSRNIYVSDPQEEEETQIAWASPMLEAFKLDKSNADYLKTDGYFNNAYRQMTLYFWKRLQDGATMDVIAKEYDQLAAEQEKEKENNK